MSAAAVCESAAAAVEDSCAALAGSLTSEEAKGPGAGAVEAEGELVVAGAAAEAGTEVGGSAGIEVAVAADVKFLTGSGVELTRVKWLVLVFWLWAPVDGPLVVGEWLRDRVRLEPCRLGDVLRALDVPVPGPDPDADAELW